ncbi:DUF1499 domain-containing protein [Paeniroseomonas aquatica]|uniref:DUF1499 domain-containing protein n=1 Tax=Paeniroseomonas aquatica TaxID=373043 RepID=UPI00361C75E7
MWCCRPRPIPASPPRQGASRRACHGATPAGGCGDRLGRAAEPRRALPRTSLIEAWPDRRQAQWVERSALVNYPDIIAAEVVPLPGGAGLYLYSRSLLGWSDLGVNRRRVDRWLAALEAALRQG